MHAETKITTEALLNAVSKLLDATDPAELLPKIIEAASQVLKSDAAVLHIPGDNPVELAIPSKISISESAVKRAKMERSVLLWNRPEDPEEDLSHSIVQNRLTSILVAPFRTPQSEDGFLYLQRAARTDAFGEDDREVFEKFVHVCEMIAFAAGDRARDKETLAVLQGWKKKGKILFASEGMQRAVDMAEKLATLPFPVILRGETGTGKEAFARYIHQAGPRADHPFVAINCGAIPESLIENILFGHVKGSFTGAIENRKGIFEEAEGGTVFLDEIGELPYSMQVRLLRVLQEKHITRVGDTKEIPVNVRVISATHVDLEEAVKRGKFREDLFFRIQVMALDIPALRDRGQDVVFLADEFLKRYSAEFGREKHRLSRAAEKALLAYHWPGNVRELENRVQKAFVTASRGIVSPEDLGLADLQKELMGSPRTLKEARDAVDRECIDVALKTSNANLTLAASMLGIDRKVLREVMERLGIKKEDYKH